MLIIPGQLLNLLAVQTYTHKPIVVVDSQSIETLHGLFIIQDEFENPRFGFFAHLRLNQSISIDTENRNEKPVFGRGFQSLPDYNITTGL